MTCGGLAVVVVVMTSAADWADAGGWLGQGGGVGFHTSVGPESRGVPSTALGCAHHPSPTPGDVPERRPHGKFSPRTLGRAAGGTRVLPPPTATSNGDG